MHRISPTQLQQASIHKSKALSSHELIATFEYTLTKEAAIEKNLPKTGLARVNERGEYLDAIGPGVGRLDDLKRLMDLGEVVLLMDRSNYICLQRIL